MDGTLHLSARQRRQGRAVARVKTAVGARTQALDPKTGRVYLPRADYKAAADGKRTRVPGTFEVLVVSP